jgi:hypothetical protein
LCPKEIKDVVIAKGHENVLATHRTTLEITKDHDLSKRGTCIIAVSADKALRDLSLEFKRSLRDENAKLTILITAGETTETISACGNPQLVLTHPTDMVIRKSSYICDRTLAVQADKTACDLSRELVGKLKNSKQKVKITLIVTV